MNVKVMGARFGCGWSETARRWRPARCCAAVASCPMWLGGGFLPDAARLWRLARCSAAMASCPMRRAMASCPMLRVGGFLADDVRRWRLARCCAAVASCPMRRGSGVLQNRARCYSNPMRRGGGVRSDKTVRSRVRFPLGASSAAVCVSSGARSQGTGRSAGD